MTRLSYDRVARQLAHLPSGDLATLLALLGHRAGPPVNLSAGEAMLLWLAGRMAADRLVRDDHQRHILSALQADVVALGDRLGALLGDEAGDKLPVGVLTVSNKCFASISGREGFLNLERGDWLPGLRSYPEVQVVYNLTGVFVNGAHVCQRDQRGG